jgi:4-hydroxybutyrate CoA-transferase
MKSWQEEYKKKFVSAAEAVSVIKSGDKVAFTSGREAFAVGSALADRREELKGVRLLVPTPTYDFGWYNEGWQESLDVIIRIPTATCQDAVDARRVDFDPGSMIPFLDIEGIAGADIIITEVSPPDENGFCSFGSSLWAKKRQVENARITIAEVNDKIIRTFGENFVHVSQIDYFVQHVSSGKKMKSGSLAGRKLKEPETYLKDIAGYVTELIKDGDTLQIGVGRTTEPLVRLGILDRKKDLGWHSEATPPGVISLVQEGIINGRLKTLHPEKVVVTSIGGSSREEMQWVDNNPLFWLVDVAYLEDIRVISAHNNMVAINNALMVDLTGQICAESIGTRQLSGAGGQIPFVIGAWLSKGGRSITVLPSTAQDGKISRIVPTLPVGTVVTIQRNCADNIVTEYGIANLKNKTLRQRAESLIAIAHPDFRSELKEAAKKLFYP